MVPGESWRVLVIDDDPDTRANLRDLLELDGLDVDTADSIAAAAKVLAETPPDMVLLDHKLPDGTAEEALPQIKLLAPRAAVAVVTGFADLDSVIGALRERADEYLIKPVNPELLRNALTKLRERQRLEERALQVERLAAIGQMVAGLAHESRNALQRSQACLEMLSLELAGQSAAIDLLLRIQAAQDELHRLFEEVREYAAPIQLERRVTGLREVWREAWERLAGERAGRGAELREPAGCSACATIDHFRLVQVFRNLFENSLAACADPVVIEIGCDKLATGGRDGMRVTVRDNGPGLKPEVARRIFEPFFTTRTRGTGLGLPIAERVVAAHDGTLVLGNPGPPGCEFVITLPCRECP
jgi:signal transduction histidine kinase